MVQEHLDKAVQLCLRPLGRLYAVPVEWGVLDKHTKAGRAKTDKTPAEWPTMAAHTAVGYLLAVGLAGAARGVRLAPALVGLAVWVVCLNGGTLSLVGNSAAATNETIGAITLGAGASTLSLTKGSLTLEGLEIVVKWTDPRGDGPAAFVHLTSGSFVASHCTFSATGQHPHGFAAVRLEDHVRTGAAGSAAA